MRSFDSSRFASPTMSSSCCATVPAVVVATATPYRHGRERSHKQVGISKKPKRRRRSDNSNSNQVRLLSHRSRPMSLFCLKPPACFVYRVSLLLLLLATVLLPAAAAATTGTTTTTEVPRLLQDVPNLSISPPVQLPTMPVPQLTPCDRSRKVFTSAAGEISDGPTGANYTQASKVH